MGTLTVLLTPLSPRSLHARCIYNATELLPLSLEVAVPPTAAPLAQPGPLQLQLRIATGEPVPVLHPLLSTPIPVPPTPDYFRPHIPRPHPHSHTLTALSSIPVLPIPILSTLAPSHSPVPRSASNPPVDESYSSYHPDTDYPLVKVLRDPIYVEVRLLQKTDPNLVLVLHQCWAAPSTSPAAEPQWPILVDG